MTSPVLKSGRPHPIAETPGVSPVKTKDPVMGKLPGFEGLADEPRLMGHLAKTNPARWGNLPFTTFRQAAGAALRPFTTASKNLGRFLIAGGATVACFAGAAWMSLRLEDVQAQRAAEAAKEKELASIAEEQTRIAEQRERLSVTPISKEEAISLLEAEMVTVPGGTFKMGSETNDDDERPVHSVTIPGTWQVAKYEMSQKIYAGLTGTNPAKQFSGGFFKYGWGYVTYGEGIVGDEKPAVGMTQQEAASACYAAGMVLPSEELWEYLARNGDKQFEYPTDDGTAFTDPNHFKEGFINLSRSAEAVTWGRPGPFGLHNLGGNVEEWTSSKYLSYVGGSPLRDTVYFVTRGGNYTNGYLGVRASNRGHLVERNDVIGLRCVRQVSK